MVICVRIVRLQALRIVTLVLVLARPAGCQQPSGHQNTSFQSRVGIDGLENSLPLPPPIDDINDTGQQVGEVTELAEVVETNEEEGDDYVCDAEQPHYDDEDYEEFYEDDDDDACCCRERAYGKLLLIGSAVLLLLGLCGIVCLTKSTNDISYSCPSVTTCFRYGGVDGLDNENTCVVNFMKASPDLSDSESDEQNIPLPLIYEDMGKICNNAEMFIQRCMTSSVKRTYSEPVKTVTSSKTKFRDYIKELAYLKERQHVECSKHGAVRAFFKEMLKLFHRSDFLDRKKRVTKDNANKETRVKIEDSTKDVLKVAKTYNKGKQRQEMCGKQPRYECRKSSSSISISSLLLKPKYQTRFYKKDQDMETLKRRRKEMDRDIKSLEQFIHDARKTPLGINPKRAPQIEPTRVELVKEIRNPKISHQNTEELIRLCVQSMRAPFTKKLVTLFDQQIPKDLDGFHEVAATLTRKIAEEKAKTLNKVAFDNKTRNPCVQRNACLPTTSKALSPIKPNPSKEAMETFDLLVKQIYLMAAKNKNMHQGDAGAVLNEELGGGGDRLVTHKHHSIEDDPRTRMIKKYQELQLEVERLNRSLRQFADDFLYSNSKRIPLGGFKNKDSPPDKMTNNPKR